MKEALRRYGALFLVLAVILAVCLMFAGRKSGMFIDEIYTYGLSNSHYAPFLDDVKGGSLRDTLMTRQELLDYVTVNEGQRFDFGSVYFNQVNDVHPPLYYWLFNLCSSLSPGVFSKWTGLIPDIIIFMAAVFTLYKLVLKLFGSRANALAAAGLYGLSNLGLSTMLMIRMYVLLTLLSLTLAYLIACLMEKPRKWLYPLVGLNIFLGLMTQYYFVFYAFFLCAAYLIYSLVKKDWRGAGLFTLFGLAGAAMLLLCFPACLSHLFADKLVSGANALENLSMVSHYRDRLLHFGHETAFGLKAAVITAAVSALLLLIFFKRLRSALREKRISFSSLVIILPAFITLIIVALISPVTETRYVYNIAPIFVTAVSFLIYLLEQSLRGLSREGLIKNCGCVLCLLLALWYARCIPPQYLYPEHAGFNKALSNESGSACVYMTDNYFAPITQDLIQLLNFDEFFISGSTDSPALLSYISSKDSENLVVFIDRDEFWSSGFDPEETAAELLAGTAYSSMEPMYSFGLSEVYLLRK